MSIHKSLTALCIFAVFLSIQAFAAPVITGLTPSSAEPGASVTIAGSGFGSSQGTVTFNGQSASVTSWSDTSIVSVVPQGASSGNVVVGTAVGVQSNMVAFTVLTPSISSISPTSFEPNGSVTISGSNFGSSGTVTFNGANAGNYVSWSDTSITAITPWAATNGNVVVHSGGLQSNGIPYTVLVPTIVSLSPTGGGAGTIVTIAGSNFRASSGGVTFNGQSATLYSWTDSSVQAIVPTGVTTGNVVISSGGLQSNGLSFTAAPIINSITPATGEPGDAVTIAGTNFSGTQGAVSFNGQAATIVSWSNTAIVAAAPNGITSGNIVVTAGSLSSNGLWFGVLRPAIASVSPLGGNAGTSVTISGAHFGSNPGSLTINGQTASISSWSDTSVVATVPAAATSGSMVISNGGLQSNGINFTVGAAINTVSPGKASPGANVTISGFNFGNTAGTVTFNGQSANIVSWADKVVVATVPANAATGTLALTPYGGSPVSGPVFVVPTMNGIWDESDIGAVAAAGSTTVSNSSVYTISAYSGSLGGTADSLHYLFQPATGDFDVIVRSTVQTQSDTRFQYGLTVRDSLSSGARSFSCLAQPGNAAAIAWRSSVNASGTDSAFGVGTVNWVRVRRYADTLQCLYSSDGVSWAQLQNTQVVPMMPGVLVGISVMSHNQALAQVAFDNFNLVSAGGSLPSPWHHQDLGSYGSAGSADYNNGVFTVSSNSVTLIPSTVDNAHFVYQDARGDLDLVAHVALLSNGATSAMAGVVVRQSLAPDDLEFGCISQPNGWGATLYRKTPALNNAGAGYPLTVPIGWVRLTRRGALFNCYSSTDGINWTLQASQELNLTAAVQAGLLVASSSNLLTAVTFDNVTLGGPSPYISPWQQQDIGSVTGPGDATLSNGVLTLESNSLDIAGSADNLHYVYQQTTGDLNISARVTAQTYSSPGAKGGLMVRQSLDPADLQFSCLSDFVLDAYASWRTSFGTADQGIGLNRTMPLWLKLSKQGSSLNCYTSNDGVTWTLFWGATVNFSGNFYVGLAQAGYNGGYSLSAFDNVVLQAQLPTVGITFPVAGSTVYLSRPVVLTAAANPSPGASVTLVQFFEGQTLLGQSSTPPYSVVLSNPSPGSHTYVARVTDSSGLISISSPDAFTVSNPKITGVNPSYGKPGQKIQVSGVGFGATRSGSSLNFNGIPATITGWSDGEVDAIVPSGSIDGPMSMSFPDGSLADGAPGGFSPCQNGGNCVISVTVSPTSDLTDGQHPITVVVTTARPANGIQVAQQLGLQCVSPAVAFWVPGMPASGGCSVTGSGVTTFTLTGTPVGVSGTSTLTGALPCSIFGCPDIGVSQAVTLIGAGQVSGSPDNGVCDTCPKIVAGHPINLTNGNTYIQQGDYSLPGLGGGISMGRTWNSLWTTTGPLVQAGMFGDSWRATYEDRLQTTSSGVNYWLDDGKVWRFSNSNGVFSLISPVNAHGTLAYDSTAQLYTLTFVNGAKKIFGSDGYLTALIDRNGNQTLLTYDSAKHLTQVTDAANRVLTFNYGDSANPNQVTSIQDAAGVIATYVYGSSAQLLSVTYADSSQILYNYDANLLITSVTDGLGKVLEAHTYDAQRRGLTSQRANGVELVTVSYPSVGVSRTMDSAGNSTSYAYTTIGEKNFPTAVSGPGCSSCGMRGFNQYTLDSQGNVTASFDSNGVPTLYTYDANANITSESTPLNDHLVTSQITYNSFGEVLTATDPLGNVTTNTYDANGNLLTTTAPAPDGTTAASVTTFTYNTLGQLTTVTDPLNHATALAYYPTGLLHTVTDAQNNVTSYEYDARGNRTAVVDALSHRTTFDYDGRNRLTVTHNPDTSTVAFGYDSRGRRTSVTDGNGKVTQYAYDDADRLTSVTDANNHVTQYAYDAENNLTSITDANNHVTSFEYDTQQHLTKTTFPSTKFETYTYDNVGNLMTKTDRKNQTILYAYDSMNRLVSKTYPDLTGVTYAYDDASRLTQVQDPTGTYSFLFDNMGRLKQTTSAYSFVSGNPFTIVYAYDAASNRTAMTDPSNGSTSYAFDTLNRISNITDFNQHSFGFTYDALGRRTQLTRPNGVTTNYGYDNMSDLLSVAHQNGAATLDGATYTYDFASNRTSKTNLLNSATSNFGYDNAYQLTSVTGTNPESYTYDPVGNRLSSQLAATYSYNSSNQVTAAGTANYTYDDNGNTLTKTDATGTTAYTWDFENRLVLVQLPNSSTVNFKYDPFGRRIEKGASVFAYDGANLIGESDTSGNLIARYAFGSGIDEPLVAYRGAASAFYEADGLGSITSLTGLSGTVSDSFTYDSFGNLASSTGSFIQPFRYTGREYDPESGLDYYRARYYDSRMGEFLSEDPANFQAGINFYQYVGANPINFSDSSGLCPPKDDITPWNSHLRDLIIAVLRGKNDCSDWFNKGTGSAPDIMSNVPIKLVNDTEKPPVLNPADASTLEDPTTFIEVNRWGRFYADSNNGLLVGGVYPAGTLGARMVILLHELAHKVNPPDFTHDGRLTDPSDASEKNTDRVMKHCAKAINAQYW